MIRRTAGFSLVEMLVALAASMLILVAVMGLYLFSFNAYLSMQNRSSLAQDSMLLVDYFRNELFVAGGGAVRGWMGIWVEDNCTARSVFPACNGSDRVTISSATVPLQQCTITGMVGGKLQIAFSAGICCLTKQAGQIDYKNNPVALTLNSFFHSSFAVDEDTAACTLTISDGQARGGDSDGGTIDWSGGMVTLMQVETLYWDSINSQIVRFQDLNNNGAVDLGEMSIVAVGVYDFQVALGYDFNPADGNILTTANGVNDEWLYNAPGVIESLGTGYFVPAPSKSSLLLVQVGVVLGVSNPNSRITSSSAQILNGPVRTQPRFTMQPEVTQLAPRNSYIFQ